MRPERTKAGRRFEGIKPAHKAVTLDKRVERRGSRKEIDEMQISTCCASLGRTEPTTIQLQEMHGDARGGFAMKLH